MYKWFKDNLCLINFVLIVIILINMLSSKRRNLVEGFDSNTIDYSALANLSKIAEKLNSGNALEFPGDLTVKGKLTVDNITAPSNTLKVTGSINSTGAVSAKGRVEGIDLRTKGGYISFVNSGDKNLNSLFFIYSLAFSVKSTFPNKSLPFLNIFFIHPLALLISGSVSKFDL